MTSLELPHVLPVSPSDNTSFDIVISSARFLTSTCDYSVIEETEFNMPTKSKKTEYVL